MADGVRDPDRSGRVLHPFTGENPTFLPGDKVRDRRDAFGRTWRIVARVAHLHSELITLREVGDDSNERVAMADRLVPYLEMVAMAKGGA